jgi:hypothetical protein
MFGNIVNSIRNWFSDWSDRIKLIQDFNKAAKTAYIDGTVPTYLVAKISSGDSNYKHQHSHWLKSGFRISVFNGVDLNKDQLDQIAMAIMIDTKLVRKMVVLGFDTLEIHGQYDTYGLKYKLADIISIGK